MAIPSIPTKRCGRKDNCVNPDGQYLPASTDYFYRCSQLKDGLQSWCKVCTSENKRRWEREHPDLVKQTKQRTRAKHKDKISEYNRQYHASHREDRLLYMHSRRHADIGAFNAYQRRWARNNMDRIRASRTKPESMFKRRAREAMRRVRVIQNGGTHTSADIAIQLKSQKGLCWWCEKPLDPTRFHVDHLIPVARGGSNSPRNLVISCASCNCSRKDKLPFEWNGRLL